MSDCEYVENYRGFDIILTNAGYDSLRYEVRHGSQVCGDYLLYDHALSAVDLWHKYFGDGKND